MVSVKGEAGRMREVGGCGKRRKLIVGVRGHGGKNATTSPGTCPEVRWGFIPSKKSLYRIFWMVRWVTQANQLPMQIKRFFIFLHQNSFFEKSVFLRTSALD
jgi:hypothetical protein